MERESFGGDLAKIAAALGQPFMPWQRAAADVGCEFDPETGRPFYRQVIVTVPRQHGKTTLYLTWQIDRCTSPRWPQPQRSAFTAQSGKDARDKWLDEIFPLIRRSRKLRPLIARSRGRLAINEGMGNESIRFVNGSLIRLLSTSTSSGHSKTLHQAVLDEIWHDQDARREQGLRPAMITVENAQLLVCSTAGTDESLILDRKIEQGRAAVEADTGYGTCYVEYSAPDGWDPYDDESYFGFMPALCPDPPCRCGGGRWRHTVTMDVIRSERDDLEAAEFARAYGNVPNRSQAALKMITSAVWAERADPQSQMADPVAVGFSVAPDRSWSSVAAAGRRLDGLGHGELVAREPGTAWLIPRLLDVAERYNPCVLVMNPAGAAAVFEAELAELGFVTKPGPGQRRLLVTGAREYAQACGALAKDVAEDRFRHLGQLPLDTAVDVAGTRPLGDAWAWSWQASQGDISALEAVTLARHGHARFGVVSVPDPEIF